MKPAQASETTSQEWTIDGDFIRAGSNLLLSIKAIADAHNAALDAERESKMPIGAFMENQQLREQLAAEREQGVKALAERSFELHECQHQLAVEQERCRKLEDALTRIVDGDDMPADTLQSIAEHALARGVK